MAEPELPETRVLSIASHVVSGHVGNKIAVFAMQSLGCDVAALNTVQFSNHTGYRQVRGTKTSAAEIWDLFEGLQQSYLDTFDMMLSGYVPGAAAVEVVGRIATELRRQAAATNDPGSFFWVLDPVMGDAGRLYVADDVVPAYTKLLVDADLILPNQFEAELLTGVSIKDVASIRSAIQALHNVHHVPHVVITSVSLLDPNAVVDPDHPASLTVVGSSMTSTGHPRLFRIVFPAIQCYFSGTGDLFGALMVVRMREAVAAAVLNGEPDLAHRRAWLSDDTVDAVKLPLARATVSVLASMWEVLSKTADTIGPTMARAETMLDRTGVTDPAERAKALHLLKSGAAELRLPRNVQALRSPTVLFEAEAM